MNANKYSFKNDYSEGCHPSILETLTKSNAQQLNGYGEDTYSTEAKALIQTQLGNQTSTIHFVSGGTQANLIVIAALLRPHESVIAANTGHIHVHEAGAIEATGHKINTVDTSNGKLTTDLIQSVLDSHHTIPHMVKPRMVYISNSTEIGTIYNKSELQKLSEYCKKQDLYLFMDGARLGSALCAQNNDLTLADIASLTDVFYIGGTKNGALLGEAIVINIPSLQTDFAYHLKQRGALLSKGRLLGIQFKTLFTDDLFFKLAKHANKMAEKLSKGIEKQGHRFLTPPASNQIFPILPNTLIEKLQQQFEFYIWESIDVDHSAIRLVTSWATKEVEVERFMKSLV